MERRAFLRTCSLGVLATAGCAVTSPRHIPETPTSDRTPNRAGVRLSFHATIVDEPTPQQPPRMRVSLVNEGGAAVRVSHGAGFWWPVVDVPDEVRLLPAGAPESTDLSISEDNCWKYTGPPIPKPAILRRTELQPGERLRQDLLVLNGRDEGCYPAGSYPFTDQVEVDGGSTALSVTLRICEDGDFSLGYRPHEIS